MATTSIERGMRELEVLTDYLNDTIQRTGQPLQRDNHTLWKRFFHHYNNQDWSDNFDSKFFHKVNISEAHEYIKALYGINQIPEALLYVQQLDKEVSEGWIKFLDDFEGKKAKTNTAKINEYDTVKYAVYIKDLNRTQIAREDFESVLSNRHKFRVIYTDKDTYLTKDPNFVPADDETSINLFEGL